MPLTLVFAGTPSFAATVLETLLRSPHTVLAVYTQPDRPAGRGRAVTASPVKRCALAHHLPVYQPKTLRDEDEQQRLRAFQADVMGVVAYGLILPRAVLDAPRLGCINVHASLLPRWRGAAPIQRALLAGDSETGVSIMQMDAGLDTGVVLKATRCAILPHDTTPDLHDRLAALGAECLLAALAELEAGTAVATVQDETHATYAHKITQQEACLDWKREASALDRCVRAYQPWPVAHTRVGDETVRIWAALPLPERPAEAAPPGTILRAHRQGIDVATGDGVLRLTRLQLAGGKPLPAEALLNAKKDLFAPGTVLGV